MLRKNNADYDNGYTTGLRQGRQKIAGKLVDRDPPSHLYGKGMRWRDWEWGYQDGLRERYATFTVATWHESSIGIIEQVWRGALSQKRMWDFVFKKQTSVTFSYFRRGTDAPYKTINAGY